MCRRAALGLVEVPLLLVGDELAAQQREEQRREQDVPHRDRNRVLPGHERGEGDQHEEGVLVQDDEEEVEELELPSAHAATQDRPAVVLHTGVAALAREVEGQPRSPGRREQRHQHEAPGVLPREEGRAGEDPDVDDGHDRPDPSTQDVSRVTSESNQHAADATAATTSTATRGLMLSE